MAPLNSQKNEWAYSAVSRIFFYPESQYSDSSDKVKGFESTWDNFHARMIMSKSCYGLVTVTAGY